MYASWQQVDDPTRFVHLFEFADQAAQDAHGRSDAVRAFEAVYKPFRADGPVVFTNYSELATNQRR
jgi:quinol monooxygenase YgiN